MAHFFKAEETTHTYYFEVCDGLPGQCAHTSADQHRRYTWSRPIVAPLDHIIAEIRLLEADRLTKLNPPTPTLARLKPSSAPLQGQEV